MKVWQKDYKINEEVARFTTWNDYILDQRLVRYECLSSIAHAKMLKKNGVLSFDELKTLIKGLNEIMALDSKGKFKISQDEEDCHSAIENFLTKKYGDIGKKLHTARSRNDQVITVMRLFEKAELAEISILLTEFKNVLDNFIKKNGKTSIPGYSHMQKAMPTKIGTWVGSFTESARDNLTMLDATLDLIDQSPLGAAAGFGVPVFKLDKKMTAEEMGFSKVMDNPMYVMLSRGKFEAAIVHILTMIMYDLNKLAFDLILYNMQEFGFITLPKEFCEGSSIMPQKKNPDVLELIRAKYHIVLAEEFKLKNLMSNLMSGYNRDGQLTKEPLFTSVDTTKDCLKMMNLVISGLKINKEKCKNAMTKELFATEEAYRLVKKGIPFREAYKQVAKKFS